MQGPIGPIILADQLTIFQPGGGGQIMATKLLLAPRIFKPSNGPVIYLWFTQPLDSIRN